MANVSLEGLTLHVADVERSLEFYTLLPGATVKAHYPGEFALLDIGGKRLGLLKQPNGNFHLELETHDLDALYNYLKELNFLVESPSQKSYGEREFVVTDPDGNTVEFAATRNREGHDIAQSKDK
jgi:catechol 2,3-dioxygenase-like lactoylglutathione lyase family enzyme